MNINLLVGVFSQFYTPARNLSECELFIDTGEIISRIQNALGETFTNEQVNEAMLLAGYKLHMTKPFSFEWMIKEVHFNSEHLIE
jgi:hypothetical protein